MDKKPLPRINLSFRQEKKKMSMLERLQASSSSSSTSSLSSSSSSAESSTNKTSVTIDLTEDEVLEEEAIQPPLKQSRTGERSFNIASHNVNDLVARHNGGNFSAIRDYINQKHVDIILLQEVWIPCGYTGGYPGTACPAVLPHKIRPMAWGFQPGEARESRFV